MLLPIDFEYYTIMIKIAFILAGHGWADCLISDGRVAVKRPASYTTDALGDLVQAILDLENSKEMITFSFDGEPTETRWILSSNGTKVRIVINEHEEIHMQEDNDDGNLLLEIQCTYAEILQSVNNLCSTILAQMTAEEFRKQWGHDFPLKNFRKSQELLNRYK